MYLQNEKLPDEWPQVLEKPNPLQQSIHRPHYGQRAHIITALWNTYDPRKRRWASRMNDCCRTARAYIDPQGGKVRPWLSKCRSRLCHFCGRAVSAKVQDGIYRMLNTMEHPKHVILTFRHRPEPLDEQISMMKSALRRLRRTADWKRIVAGGIYTIETTYNTQTERWHPHLHILIDSGYFPQKRLARLWESFMPGGKNVWIKPVNNNFKASWEISKYIGKPPKVTEWPLMKILQYAAAVHGTRLVQTFGSYSKYKINPDFKTVEESPDVYYVSLNHLVTLAANGQPQSINLAILIARRWPIFSRFIKTTLPSLPDQTTAERRLNAFRHARGTALPEHNRGPPTAAEREKTDRKLFIAFTAFKNWDIDREYIYTQAAEAV